MLKLTVVLKESFNEETNEFLDEETIEIELEHSLASVSKWEEIWEKPFLATNDKTDEMTLSYLQCMCLTPDVSPEVFEKLTEEQMTEISEHLEKKHTATWFSSDRSKSGGNRIITAELIYYWMSAFRIDWEAQYWPLNKLLTLIQVFSAEQDDKSPRQRTRSRQMDIARINAQRRAELGSRG